MYRRRVKRPPPPVFGSTLEEMGFSINERSQIVDQSGNPYKFDLKAKDREYQEAHSRALGEVTTAVVLKKLQEELGLTPIKVPFGMDEDDETSPHASILVSPDAKQCKRLLVLISGTLETLGIWSRRLMTNNSVDEGSMYFTVKQALKEGYGIVILNPNAHWWVEGRATNAANYIQSEVEDKNKVGYRETIGCNCVNAGTHEYDYTIIEMMPTIFRFFNARKDRNNEFDKNKDVLLPPNEDDPTTVVITFDEAVEEETPSTVTEDDSGWHDTTPMKI
ncbi:hypothetical protein EC968_007167 [Mortierella alpina]|nr:hypothetical protein EC968_007167 [Mortierella alpina]